MNRPFFVMLNHPNGYVVPMVEGEDVLDLATYATEEEAIIAANQNSLGETFGFEVFECGRGNYNG